MRKTLTLPSPGGPGGRGERGENEDGLVIDALRHFVCIGRLIRQWKRQMERRPAAGFGVYRDGPAEVVDETFDQRETDAGALIAGRLEGLEQPIANFVG